MVRRSMIPALIALIAGAGCSAGTPGGQVRQPPPLSRETLTTTRIIAQINKNARAIQSLEVDPAIEVSEGLGDDVDRHNVRGRMRMEREKDFRLVLSVPVRGNVADIGSNSEGFWFWVKDQNKKENVIYACDYEHVGSSRLSETMQPDWIMESMGLREFSDHEAATIDARPGEVSGQVLLTQIRKGSNGATYTKETVVNEKSGEIIEHRLYAGASKKELLARATIKSSTTKMIASDNGGEVKVILPNHFVLEWVAEKFKLDITMGSSLKVNPRFTKENVANLFTEPTISGATRVDLATMGQAQAAAAPSRVYETMPRSGIRETMPRSGIRLGQPQAVPSGEGANSTRSSSSRSSRGSSRNDLPDLPPDPTVIGPGIPQGSANDPTAVQASARGLGLRPVFEN